MKKKNSIKFFIFIIAFVSALPVFGQKYWSSDRHEIRLGLGIAPITNFGEYYLGSDKLYPTSGTYTDYYYGDKIFSPAVNFGYSYQFKKWLSFGVILTYKGIYQNYYDLINDNLRGKYRKHYIGVTPTVRFDWLNKKVVRLYSAVGLGIGVSFENDNENYIKNYSQGASYTTLDTFPTLDLTYIGISVGRKIYGFGELSLGSNGFIKLGIGYRFDIK